MTNTRPTRLRECDRYRVSYVDTIGPEGMLNGKPFGGASGAYFVSPEYLRDAFGATVELVDSEQGTLPFGDTPSAVPAGPNAVSDRDFYSALLDRLGFVDGAEVTADGSADNDLAAERADVVLEFISRVRRSACPQKLLPPVAGPDTCMAFVPDGSESAAPCDRPVVAGTGRCDQHQCNGDWACPAVIHAFGCMVLPAELLNAPIRFWVCPIVEHRRRTDDKGDPVETVVWRGDVAHCTMPSCAQTSQARRWRPGHAEPEDRPPVFDADGNRWTYNPPNRLWFGPRTVFGSPWFVLLDSGPLTEDLSAITEATGE